MYPMDESPRLLVCKAHGCLRKVSIFRPKPLIFERTSEISKQTLDMNSILLVNPSIDSSISSSFFSCASKVSSRASTFGAILELCSDTIDIILKSYCLIDKRKQQEESENPEKSHKFLSAQTHKSSQITIRTTRCLSLPYHLYLYYNFKLNQLPL
ncbi:hypothetical protein Scep_012031 [Stephania cephalantha]|uniref:Uncharacterized protein n=1 Tax=Stephania cephalantha TaxID=152367 RepID=A0AAP0P6D8_9MAGN